MLRVLFLSLLLQGSMVNPVDAVDGILDAFGEYDLVAIGERHDMRETWAFYLRLVADPRFPDASSDIVLEVANARHQDLLDEFVMGGDVSFEQVRSVWRDATNSLLQEGDPPGLENLLLGVRRINSQLESGRKIRVLAGDPPIDWQAPDLRSQFGRYLSQRDAHYAKVVIEQVLQRGRKALLIMGRSHLTRVSTGDSENVAQRLEAHRPGSLFLVHLLHSRNRRVERESAEWPRPSVIRLSGTWLDDLAPEFLAPALKQQGATYATTVDAVLFLGQRSELKDLPVRPFEAEHLRELMRRQDAVQGQRR